MTTHSQNDSRACAAYKLQTICKLSLIEDEWKSEVIKSHK